MYTYEENIANVDRWPIGLKTFQEDWTYHIII